MVNFYVKMIRLGRMTVDQVPELWRDAVIAALDEG